MACGTVVGDDTLEFGIDADEAGLVTQSVQVTNKSDKKEGRNKCGDVVAVAYYNKTSDIQIEGLGTSANVVGDALSLAGSYPSLAGAAFIDEVTIEKANEEFVKTSIKATAYAGISPTS